MKVEIKKVTIALRGHYDQDKTTSVVAEYNGCDYYITQRQMNAAARRAGLIEGDWFEFADGTDKYHLIVEG